MSSHIKRWTTILKRTTILHLHGSILTSNDLEKVNHPNHKLVFWRQCTTLVGSAQQGFLIGTIISKSLSSRGQSSRGAVSCHYDLRTNPSLSWDRYQFMLPICVFFFRISPYLPPCILRNCRGERHKDGQARPSATPSETSCHRQKDPPATDLN